MCNLVLTKNILIVLLIDIFIPGGLRVLMGFRPQCLISADNFISLSKLGRQNACLLVYAEDSNKCEELCVAITHRGLVGMCVNRERMRGGFCVLCIGVVDR